MSEPLVSTTDWQTYSGTEADARVAFLIDAASAVVRRYLGQTVTHVEDDEVTITPRSGAARLPQVPVTAVTEVTRNGTTLDPAGYSWTRQGVITGPDAINRFDMDLVWGTAPLTVTYSHGYEQVPADIALAVLMLVQRAVDNPKNLRSHSEAIGDWNESETYSVPATGVAMGMTVDSVVAGLLDPYRPPVGVIDTYPSWA